jgi:hypothetical protein
MGDRERLGDATMQRLAQAAEQAVERGGGSPKAFGHRLQFQALVVPQLQHLTVIRTEFGQAAMQRLRTATEVFVRLFHLTRDRFDEGVAEIQPVAESMLQMSGDVESVPDSL